MLFCFETGNKELHLSCCDCWRTAERNITVAILFQDPSNKRCHTVTDADREWTVGTCITTCKHNSHGYKEALSAINREKKFLMKTLKYAFQVAETAVNLSSLAHLNQ